MDIVERMRRGERISIGMVHTLPLPGALRNTATIDEITERAVADAVALERAGFDAIEVENVNDGPYETNAMTYQKVAALTKVCTKVREAVGIPMGIDSCGDPIAGFSIGKLTGVSFIRIPYFVDIRITSRGVIFPNAGDAVMERERLGAQEIKIFADIQVKHSYPLIPAIPLEESAKWAVSCAADALIVTGAETGASASLDDLARVKRVAGVPVVAGSGVRADNVAEQYAVCDGAIIGSSLKQGGNLLNPIDGEMAAYFMRCAGSCK